MRFLQTQDTIRPWSCEEASLAYGTLAAPGGLSFARRLSALQNEEFQGLDANERSRFQDRPLLVDVLALGQDGVLANSGRTMLVLQGWAPEEKQAFRHLVEHLLAMGADPSLQDSQGRDALDQALLLGDMALLDCIAQAWPLGKPLRLNERAYTVGLELMPALHWGVCASTPAMVKWLLHHGATPDRPDARGCPALWRAQRPEMVDALHACGANLQLRIKGQRLPALFLPNDKASLAVAARWHALVHHSREELSPEEVDAIVAVVCDSMALSTAKEFSRQWKLRGSSIGTHGSVLKQANLARLLKNDNKGDPLLKWSLDTAQFIPQDEVPEVLWGSLALFPGALGQKAMLGRLGLLAHSQQAKTRWEHVMEGLLDAGPWQGKRGWRHRIAKLLSDPIHELLPLSLPIGDGGVPLVWALLHRMGSGLYDPGYASCNAHKRTVEAIACGHDALGNMVASLPQNVLHHPLAFSCLLPLLATPVAPAEGPLLDVCRQVAAQVHAREQLPGDISLLARVKAGPRHVASILEGVLLQVDTQVPTASRSAHRL